MFLLYAHCWGQPDLPEDWTSEQLFHLALLQGRLAGFEDWRIRSSWSAPLRSSSEAPQSSPQNSRVQRDTARLRSD